MPTYNFYTSDNYLQNELDGRGRCLGTTVCLSVHPNDSKNTLAMETCSRADNQQWKMRLTNRETGATSPAMPGTGMSSRRCKPWLGLI